MQVYSKSRYNFHISLQTPVCRNTTHFKAFLQQSWYHPWSIICGITKARCVHLDKHAPSYRDTETQREAYDRQPKIKAAALPGWHQVTSLSSVPDQCCKGKALLTSPPSLLSDICFLSPSAPLLPSLVLIWSSKANQLTDLKLKECKPSKKAELNHFSVKLATGSLPLKRREPLGQ